MRIPSIGYEDDAILSRVSIAQIQLVEAINLFVAKKFLCAITLGGAAEEILGKLALKGGKLPVIHESLQRIRAVEEKLGRSISGGQSDIRCKEAA